MPISNHDSDQNSTRVADDLDVSQQGKQPLPGDFAIWLFIFAELLVFGVFFLAFAFARLHHLDEFNAGQLEIDRRSGAINTLLLITGSYFVAQAVQAIRKNQNKVCCHWLSLGIMTGVFFIISKCLGYADLFAQGINLTTNTFYMFYLSLTGFHFMHVIMGVIILIAVWLKAWRGGYSANDCYGVESAASYWHMVDLVWIILFPLVYIMR